MLINIFTNLIALAQKHPQGACASSQISAQECVPHIYNFATIQWLHNSLLLYFVCAYLQIFNVDATYKVELEFTLSEAQVEEKLDAIITCVFVIFLFLCLILLQEYLNLQNKYFSPSFVLFPNMFVFLPVSTLSEHLQLPPMLLLRWFQSSLKLLQRRGKFLLISSTNISRKKDRSDHELLAV